MRDTIRKILDAFLRPLKLTVLKQKEFAGLQGVRNGLVELYNFDKEKGETTKGTVSCLIFSMDRAMQLHALLRSLEEQVLPAIPVYILYAAGNDQHRQAYKEVEQYFTQTSWSFHEQQDKDSFRMDLLHMLSAINTEKIFFLVDDIVFIEPVDLHHLIELDTKRFVPSLRLGLNLSWCYPLQKNQCLPAGKKEQHLGEEYFIWKWNDGECDWCYPLSVDGHIFSKPEIEIILRHVQFSAPNSLEDALQLFRDIFLPRQGICHAKAKLLNIPCNKVQDENKNISGDVDPDDLLKLWQEGMMIDIQKLYGYTNQSAHEEINLSFVRRQ